MGIQNNEIDDGLTDEERAALEDGEEETTLDPKLEEESKKTEPQPKDPPEADDPKEAEAEVEVEVEIKEQAAAPILVADAPADADDKLKAIATQKEDLITKFDDGEITAKEYQQQLDALSKQEREVELALHKASMAAEMEQQRLKNEWLSTVNSFIESNPVYKDNPRLYRALDQEVRDVANSEEGKTMSGAKILAKAHQNLAEAFGLQVKAQDKTKASRELPPSLHGVPAADTNDVQGGKYAALDRLMTANPLGYEEALMKLSDSERDAYLASQ